MATSNTNHLSPGTPTCHDLGSTDTTLYHVAHTLSQPGNHQAKYTPHTIQPRDTRTPTPTTAQRPTTENTIVPDPRVHTSNDPCTATNNTPKIHKNKVGFTQVTSEYPDEESITQGAASRRNPYDDDAFYLFLQKQKIVAHDKTMSSAHPSVGIPCTHDKTLASSEPTSRPIS